METQKDEWDQPPHTGSEVDTSSSHIVTAGIAGAATALAALPLGPGSSVVAGALTPVITHLSVHAVDRLQEQIMGRRENVLRTAATHSEVSLEELFARINMSDSNLLAFGTVMDAAARTTNKRKLRMLAHALSNLVITQSPESVDREPLMLAAIVDLDPLHVRLLSAIADPVDRGPNGATEARLAHKLGVEVRDAAVLQPLIRTLDRHGLIGQSTFGQPYDIFVAEREPSTAPDQVPAPPDDSSNAWKLTSFGRELLTRIEAADTDADSIEDH